MLAQGGPVISPARPADLRGFRAVRRFPYPVMRCGLRHAPAGWAGLVGLDGRVVLAGWAVSAALVGRVAPVVWVVSAALVDRAVPVVWVVSAALVDRAVPVA